MPSFSQITLRSSISFEFLALLYRHVLTLQNDALEETYQPIFANTALALLRTRELGNNWGRSLLIYYPLTGN